MQTGKADSVEMRTEFSFHTSLTRELVILDGRCVKYKAYEHNDKYSVAPILSHALSGFDGRFLRQLVNTVAVLVSMQLRTYHVQSFFARVMGLTTVSGYPNFAKNDFDKQ